MVSEQLDLSFDKWKDIRTQLSEDWMWDVDFHTTHNAAGNDRGCWTYTPTNDEPKNFPLSIAGAPVVIPVDYRWPPVAGVNPPPDPRPSTPIDCAVEIPLDVVRDVFLTFEGSIGFYLLVNGLLQIIVPRDFDTAWASSHLPHKYGGLQVSYITQSMDPTMFPSKTETMRSRGSQLTQSSQSSGISSLLNQFRPSTTSLSQPLQLNDLIEARAKSSHKKDKFAGRIGLKVGKEGYEYLVMPTHVITEAILAKSGRSSLFGRRKEPTEQLEGDWNEQVELWAGNEKIGSVEKSFDPEAEIYPDGFKHDVTLIKPANPAALRSIQSPVPDLGWLSRESWNGLRQQPSCLKLLGETENHRRAKTLKTSRPAEVLIIGEGIFLNQTSSPKPTKDHDMSVWRDLVSRCVLYRVYPDFDPPTGHSGIALYANGLREDGTTGPGVVGFQSFVQRSGHVQSFEMEGSALEKRLKLGRVAFYGAFQAPEELKTLSIV
ncbi:hypothetical protein BDV96DRAFT_496981 [Lophiotrema nucula]|uniref:Uncharacterized protein n=1 Tax=Lophiotrema nucula TaxID=690887 RepID=A0A6A5Z1Q6_9PLEO|nr:hypothetical protein BDV96DRAFT_496981 [Lophiotrema nucula]